MVFFFLSAKLRETFKKLHFKVRECNETKAENILRYLENIADEDHSPYDCFVICFSTHGGNGFVCCSDFQRNYRNETEKGFILFTTLLELFLPNKCKSLSGKPKLFFFDCCRSVDNTRKYILGRLRCIHIIVVCQGYVRSTFCCVYSFFIRFFMYFGFIIFCWLQFLLISRAHLSTDLNLTN